MLREFYTRAFSHVLPHVDEEGAPDRHGHEPLEAAVKHFRERQDRKCYDENFRILLKALVAPGSGANHELNPRYLCLMVEDDARANDTSANASQEASTGPESH